jgi:two-component system sensor histidine kinase CreC
LSAIRGAAELLGEEMPREERVRFIANLRAESDRVQRVVDRLLELSALEARSGREGFAAVELREVAGEVVAHARSIAARRQIEIVFPAGAAVHVKGERFLLTQAMGNLLQNAIEFSPAGSVVALELHVTANSVVVRVDDHGTGIPAFAVEKVFDRFYSLPRPDSGRKSSGLGLSIVREIARLHGGEVTLENRPDGGARAILSLPTG